MIQQSGTLAKSGTALAQHCSIRPICMPLLPVASDRSDAMLARTCRRATSTRTYRAPDHRTSYVPRLFKSQQGPRPHGMICKNKITNRSDITTDPSGHRPPHPCAQGRNVCRHPAEVLSGIENLRCIETLRCQCIETLRGLKTAVPYARQPIHLCTACAQLQPSPAPHVHLCGHGLPALDRGACAHVAQ